MRTSEGFVSLRFGNEPVTLGGEGMKTQLQGPLAAPGKGSATLGPAWTRKGSMLQLASAQR